MNYLKRTSKPALAYVQTTGDKSLPTVLFCGGFRSDMQGTKALYLEQACRARGQAYIRFDYSGHGQSEGRFEDLTLTDWLGDTLDILDDCTRGGVIVVGSSMGGWIGLLLALQRPERIQALVGLAAAPDFTCWIEEGMTEKQKESMAQNGFIFLGNAYSEEPYIITRRLLEDGRTHCLLSTPIAINCPVRLVQGRKDYDVPFVIAQQIKEAITGKDVEIIAIDDGDHRLSKPEDLQVIDRIIAGLSGLDP